MLYVLRLALLVVRDVVRENEFGFTGCLPRAFSLILRDCMGNASSTAFAPPEGAFLGVGSSSLSSPSSSSSPMANALYSGTFPNLVCLAGPLALSRDPLRGLATPVDSPTSLRSRLMRSTSSRAPSTVKSRSASKRLRLFTMTSTKRRFSAPLVRTKNTRAEGIHESRAMASIHVKPRDALKFTKHRSLQIG